MPLSDTAERTRVTLYRHFADTGRALDPAGLATATGRPIDEVRADLSELAAARHIVLAGEEVVLAHPFASRSFRFSVMGPDTLWWGGCAWDAFAIPHLVPDAHSVLVATTCPACGSAHAWTVTNEQPPVGEQVAHFLVPAADIWPDAVHACENQQIFCDEGCVDAWLRRTGNTRGDVLSLTTLWNLAAHWYDGRLDSPYERRDPTRAAAYFRQVGLRGPFWGLPDDA
ncbi:organomercurial lyase [Microbacterium testaceum]|uniref:organomercurial lyase n=1 Tax=Microbacterium testaceum TaxID=2033 RepID=UPI0022E343A3|nr:organomercurial lyase [Microbacterium testaceum]